MLDTNRYTWRHNNLINFIVTSVDPTFKVYSDLCQTHKTAELGVPETQTVMIRKCCAKT